LLRRANFKIGLRWMVATARLGGACLGLGVIASSLAPETVLALLAAVALVLGGVIWTPARRHAPVIRVLASVAVVGLARWGGGPLAAILAALLLALGAWVRVRVREAISGLAVFGCAVALTGHASIRLVAAFWLLGVALSLIRALAAGLRRRFSRSAGRQADVEGAT
jgi:hypothetical protein